MTITPASIRNNNPGAAEPGFASRRFGSRTHEVLKWRDARGKLRTNKIATFATPVHGAASNFYLLAHGRHYRNKSIRDAVSTWCGGYSAAAYAKALSAVPGITAETVLSEDLLRNVEFAVPLLTAMAKWEAGRDFPMDEAGFREGHAMAFGQAVAPPPSPDNDVPAQKPEGQLRQVITDTAAVTAKVILPASGAVAVANEASKPAVPPVPSVVTDNLTNAEGYFALSERVAGLAKGVLSFELGSLMAVAGVLLALGAAYLIKPRDA